MVSLNVTRHTTNVGRIGRTVGRGDLWVLARSSVIDLNLGLISSLLGLDISLSLPKEG